MGTDVSAGELILLPPDVNELTPPYATAITWQREFTPAKVTHQDAVGLHRGLSVTHTSRSNAPTYEWKLVHFNVHSTKI